MEVTYESALYILLNFFWHDYTTSLIVEPLMANEFSSSDGGQSCVLLTRYDA